MSALQLVCARCGSKIFPSHSVSYSKDGKIIHQDCVREEDMK